jgi:pSer/pThr/pTyr-binding forkhead associated (FHA) protein
LVCLVGPVQGQSFPLGQGVYLGRDAARAQVVVQDSQVSGQHVWVGPLAGRIVARDPGSTNGTFLNDPASPRIGEAELRPGDRLFLGPKGSVVFEYRP